MGFVSRPAENGLASSGARANYGGSKGGQESRRRAPPEMFTKEEEKGRGK